MTTPQITPPQSDTRRDQILLAAFEVFCAYGFRRTSMEDIARAASLSRAALYLHFRNKEDVYCSLVKFYYTVTAARVAEVLQPGLPPVVALSAMFTAKSGPELEAMLSSPHGAELLDAKLSLSADIVTNGEAQLSAMLADWLRAESAAGRVHLPDAGADANALATTINAAVHGLKTPSLSYADYVAGLNRLAALFGRGLSV